MIVFRIVVAILPQLLLVLVEGGRLDLLGGWNHTGSALAVLMALFLVTPVATGALLVVEIRRHRRHIQKTGEERASGSLRMVAFAIFLFLESLAVDLLILSRLRMH